MKKILFIILCVLSASTCWAGNNIYVDGGAVEGGATWDSVNGHSYTCSHGSGTGYSTIATAVAAMSGGDDIYIRGGTYYEKMIYLPPSTSGTSGDWSSIQSYPNEWAIVDGQNTLPSGLPCALFFNAYSQDESGGGTYANYWKIERLELTGGSCGTDASAILWVKGPLTVRYCYIHDNLGSSGGGLPGGIRSGAIYQATIEYNYFKNNGTTSRDSNTNNAAQIYFMGTTEFTHTPGYDYDETWFSSRNIVRYNYLDTGGSGAGIKNKHLQRMETNRDGSSPAFNTWGDKIHHNVVLGGSYNYWGIGMEQDWVQIYNNIIVSNASGSAESYTNFNQRKNNEGCDTIWPCFYNNTVIGGNDSSFIVSLDGKYTTTFQASIFNNIIDNHVDSTDASHSAAIGYAHHVGGYYGGQSWSSFTKSDVSINRNLFYDCDASSVIEFGNYVFYTVGSWLSFRSETNWDNNAGSLYRSTYVPYGNYALDGTYTIATGGIGGSHPYLTGVTIPSYVGAVNPSDYSWVAGVQGLNVAYFTTAVAGSTPSWIEGGAAPPSAQGCTISGSTYK